MVDYFCFSTFTEANKLTTSIQQPLWLLGFIWIYQDASTAEDDDDLDLFGDETEEDKKAAEEREASKKPAKKKESEISFWVFTVICCLWSIFHK